mgnify:CR=1 FL=1|jgi:hypothetical protein
MFCCPIVIGGVSYLFYEKPKSCFNFSLKQLFAWRAHQDLNLGPTAPIAIGGVSCLFYG